MINFISILAQHNDFARDAAIEGGFLDMLLRIYVVLPTFYMATAESTTEKRSRRAALFDTCRSALDILSTKSYHFDMVFNHPVYDLWLRCDKLVPNYVVWTAEEALDARCIAWRKTESDIITRRLMTIWNLSPSSDALFRACLDIVEFTRSIPHYPSQVFVSNALMC